MSLESNDAGGANDFCAQVNISWRIRGSRVQAHRRNIGNMRGQIWWV